MQNITSLINKQQPQPKAESVDSAQRAIAHTAWMNQAYSGIVLAELESEADEKINKAMELASVDGVELQLRRLLIEAKSLRDTVRKMKQNEHSNTAKS